MNEPGCFGAASVFSHDSDWCKRCPAFERCSDASMETLKRIRATVSVDALIAKHQVASEKLFPKSQSKPVERATTTPQNVGIELTSSDAEAVSKITNAHAKNLALSLCMRGDMFEARERLQAGTDPMAGKDKPIGFCIATRLLTQGGFTQKELREVFERERGWAPTTASTQASIIMAVLVAFNLVDRIDERYVVKGKE